MQEISPSQEAPPNKAGFLGFFHGKNLASFEKIYAEHQNMVRSLVFRLVGSEALEDLVQESFVKVWRGLPKFRGQSSLKTWIYRVTSNACFDFLKKQKKLGRQVGTAEDQASPIEPLNQRLYHQQVLELGLNKVSQEHRQILILFYLEGLSLKEIAKVLQKPLGTAQTRLFHARKNMLSFLEEKGITL